MDATSRDAREALPGWVWVGVGGALLVLGPLWVLLTAAVIQLTPELAGWSDALPAGMEAVPDEPWWRVWLIGGTQGGLGLVILLGVVGALTGAGAVGAWWKASRERAVRVSRDADVDGEAVLDGVTLHARSVHTYDPRLDDSGSLPLSTPGTRLVAAFVDLVTAAVWFPLLPLLAVAVGTGIQDALDGEVLPPGIAVFVRVCAVVFVAWLAAQHVLLARTGQTVGKRLLGIRVVSADGRPASFAAAIGLRWWVWGLVLAAVPVVGWVVGPVIDLVLLFDRDHRTLHDLLAGTVVVDVR